MSSRAFRRSALTGAVLAAALGVGTVVAACGSDGPDGVGSSAGSALAGGPVLLSVADPYIPLPAAGGMAAGYLTVRNDGAGEDQLVKVTSPAADSVTLHRSTDSTMEELGSLAVPAHGALQLARGGTHLMIMGWEKPPAVGDELELDLTFAKAGTIAIRVPVKPLTYRPGQ
ncbi:copper chaperone PCu(A)C [Kitasatospora sp. NPDC050543]|uniref:copper chaperone PCu(A)C n=1 Tax=Kitasatospora sp. NPDC050543 TaxID=3364054 RepID=UPI0037AADE44